MRKNKKSFSSLQGFLYLLVLKDDVSELLPA